MFENKENKIIDIEKLFKKIKSKYNTKEITEEVLSQKSYELLKKIEQMQPIDKKRAKKIIKEKEKNLSEEREKFNNFNITELTEQDLIFQLITEATNVITNKKEISNNKVQVYSPPKKKEEKTPLKNVMDEIKKRRENNIKQQKKEESKEVKQRRKNIKDKVIKIKKEGKEKSRRIQKGNKIIQKLRNKKIKEEPKNKVKTAGDLLREKTQEKVNKMKEASRVLKNKSLEKEEKKKEIQQSKKKSFIGKVKDYITTNKENKEKRDKEKRLERYRKLSTDFKAGRLEKNKTEPKKEISKIGPKKEINDKNHWSNKSIYKRGFWESIEEKKEGMSSEEREKFNKELEREAKIETAKKKAQGLKSIIKSKEGNKEKLEFNKGLEIKKKQQIQNINKKDNRIKLETLPKSKETPEQKAEKERRVKKAKETKEKNKIKYLSRCHDISCLPKSKLKDVYKKYSNKVNENIGIIRKDLNKKKYKEIAKSFNIDTKKVDLEKFYKALGIKENLNYILELFIKDRNKDRKIKSEKEVINDHEKIYKNLKYISDKIDSYKKTKKLLKNS